MIVALSLCPRFDEALAGYGRNKALHALQLHRCGARFWVSTEACLLHQPHAPSVDFVAAGLGGGDGPADGRSDGPHGLAAGRQHLLANKRRYEVASALLAVRCNASCIGANCELGPPRRFVDDEHDRRREERWRARSRSFLAPPVASFACCCSWAVDMPAEARRAARRAERAARGAQSNTGDPAHRRLTQLCTRWMQYAKPSVTILDGGEAASSTLCAAKSSACCVWLATHFSPDRVEQFCAQLESWPGSCAAAVWLGAEPSLRAAERMLEAITARIRRVARPPDAPGVRLTAAWGPSPTWRPRRRVRLPARHRPVGGGGVYPANVLRNQVLRLVPHDALVMLLDVDARPPRALGAALGIDHGGDVAAAALRERVVDECRAGRFVVLPAVELAPASQMPLASDEPSPASDADSFALVEAVDVSTAHAVLAQCAGRLRAFHAAHHPDAHHPTGTTAWRDTVLGRAPSVVDVATLTYAAGYEPYGICEVQRLTASGMQADERFIGWHKDRAEWLHRLHALGAFSGMCVLRSPAACVVDWKPHAATHQRATSRNDLLYLCAMEGLYERSLRRQSAWVSALAPRKSPDLVSSCCAPVASAMELLRVDGAAVATLREGGDVWLADAEWSVSGSLQNVASPGAHTVQVTLVGGVGTPSSAHVLGTLESGVAVRAAPSDAEETSLGVALEFEVCFDEESFQWGHGGSLPGMHMEPGVTVPQGGSRHAGCGMSARFRWTAEGELRLKIERLDATGARWPDRHVRRIGTLGAERRPMQLLRGRWHRLALAVRRCDGRICAWCDGVCFHDSGGGPAAQPLVGGAADVLIRLFHSEAPPKQGSTAQLRAMRVLGARGVKLEEGGEAERCAVAESEITVRL